MISGALISDDGIYRYSLWRHWGAGAGRLVFIMLNPSTADGSDDDPTIRRCIAFARREGFDGLEVLNLFAFRSPHPSVLRHEIEVNGWAAAAGEDNAWHWKRVLSVSDVAVAAWGASAPTNRLDVYQDDALRSFTSTISGSDGRLVCLGRTKTGFPRHPLYVKGDQPFEPYDWRP